MTPKLNTLLDSGQLFTLARPYWKPPFSYDRDSQAIYDVDTNIVVHICGFSRLAGTPMSQGKAMSIQDEVGEHTALLLNEAWAHENKKLC